MLSSASLSLSRSLQGSHAAPRVGADGAEPRGSPQTFPSQRAMLRYGSGDGSLGEALGAASASLREVPPVKRKARSDPFV